MFELMCGNSLEILKNISDKSINMIITSPPYYNLRDYGSTNEIGKEKTVDDYINNLLAIFNECYRVLKDDGSMWINIDDVYINQSLACIPDRLKMELVSNGWICRNEVIWHKPNAMPSSVKTRFNNDYEKLFFFTKSKYYFFNTQYEPFKSKVIKNSKVDQKSKYLNTKQEASVRQGMNKARGTKIIAIRKELPTQEEFITFMRSRTSSKEIAENSTIKKSTIDHWFRRDRDGFAYPTIDDWNSVKWLVDDFSNEFMEMDYKLNEVTFETDDIMKNIEKGRLKRAVWSISTKGFKGCHFAPYPEELVETPIKSCCPIEGTVLDPFMGSGTTGVMCKKLNINFIGIDINKDYVELARNRINQVKNFNSEVQKTILQGGV